MVIGQLICSAVECVKLEDGVTLHYNCPACGAELNENVSLNNISEAGIYDFNQKISFFIPSHIDAQNQQPCNLVGEAIELFLALHRDANGLKVWVQKSDAEGASGIPEDWWQLP